MAITMDNWRRATGATWTRPLGKFRAQVSLGKGGWYWIVVWQDGTVVATGDKPTRRSRKARRQSQRALLALQAMQPVMPVTKVRLAKVAAAEFQEEHDHVKANTL